MKCIAASAKFLVFCCFILTAFIAKAQPDGTIDTTFNPGTGANGTVNTTALQPDGKILIGGEFTSYKGTARNRIARLNADGNLDTTFNPGTGTNGTVYTTALQPDGKIIIGGDFTSYNGTARIRIARLNADGSLDTTFNPSTGANYFVETTALQPDGKIIIGGNFTTYNGTARNRIARLNANGSVDTTFNPGTGTNFQVSTTALQPDGKILIGGDFIVYNSTARNRIARVNADGSLDTTFNPGTGANGGVDATALQPNGKIIIGGTFSSYNGTARNYIARLNADGSLDATFNPGAGANDNVNTTALQPDGKIIIGGWFTSYNGTTRNHIARLNADGSLDATFKQGQGASGPVVTTALQPDGKIIIGGDFSIYNGYGRKRIARLHAIPKGVYGYLYNDLNQNCLNDVNESGVFNRRLIISNGSSINYSLQTDTYGYWSVDSLPAGTYTVLFDTSGNWSTVCSTSINFTVIKPDSITLAPTFGLFSTQPCASPNVSVHAPFLRPCFSNQKVYVNACNENIATGALNNAYVELELDSLLIPQSASLAYTSLGNNKYHFNLGNLNPGMCKDFYVSCSLSCDAALNQTLCMNAKLFPADSCVFDTTSYFPEGVALCNTEYDGSNLSVRGSCYENDSMYFEIVNAGSGDMICYAPVRIYVDGQMMQFDSIMLASGDTATYVFSGDGRTWRLETEQHPEHPGLFSPNATVENCGNSANWTPNLVNILPLDDADPIIDIYCGLVTGSYDPNDKTGYPLGVSQQHYIKPNQPIEYVIRFQNTGTDTAFTVVIRDTLSTDLDVFSVASGVSSHEYSFRMYGPRVLEWTFNNIQLPDSNVNEPASNGFVMFTVNQAPDLPNNTLIENSASIYFDYNAPIITNSSEHTINNTLQIPTWTFTQNSNLAACDSFVLNSFIYKDNGTYYQRVIDTVFVLNLTVNESPVPVIMLNGGQLLATNTSYVVYEWLLNGQPVGGNDTSYTFTQSGNYSLQVTDSNGCVGTSNTINVTFVGIGNNQQNQFHLTAYPNPYTQSTIIQYTLAQSSATTLKIYDVLGKELMQTKNTNQPQGTHQIQFENTANGKGIYIVELTVNGSKTLKRIVQVE